MRCVFAALALLLAACAPSLIPADEPPQLRHTPGLFVRFDGRIYDAQVFRVRVPDGWRVIKVSTADAPMQVVFAAPQDDLRIAVSAAPLPVLTPEAGQIILEELRGNPARPITVRAQGPAAELETLRIVYERVLASLEVSHSAPD